MDRADGRQMDIGIKPLGGSLVESLPCIGGKQRTDIGHEIWTVELLEHALLIAGSVPCAAAALDLGLCLRRRVLFRITWSGTITITGAGSTLKLGHHVNAR